MNKDQYSLIQGRVKQKVMEASVHYHIFCGEENFLFDLFKHISSDRFSLVFEDEIPIQYEKKVKRLIIKELRRIRCIH